MHNSSSVVPPYSVDHVSCRVFSDDSLAYLLTVVLNRSFGNRDDHDWVRWTSTGERITTSLESWIVDCHGKSRFDSLPDPAFVCSSYNTGDTVIIIWSRPELTIRLMIDTNSLLYRVQIYI